MKKVIIFLCFVVNAYNMFAQQRKVLCPSKIEVKYDCLQARFRDMYILRCGEQMSQFFSFYKLREDSLSADPTGEQIIAMEFLDALEHPENPSKRIKSSPIKDEYMYTNYSANKISVYSTEGEKYLVEEEIPNFEWVINEDSVVEILDYDCVLATTHFRGRDWNVWFTLDLPLSVGPWKFSGLPGLILKAECVDFMCLEARDITTDGISPVTFYNFENLKFNSITRKDYLKFLQTPRNLGGFISKPSPTMEIE